MGYVKALAFVVVLAVGVPAWAQPLPTVLYSTDFETDQSSKFNIDPGLGAGATNGFVNVFAAYPDLGGRNGHGLKVQPKTEPVATGIATYSATLKTLEALGLSQLSGNYRVNFDMYTSYASPPGAGTTEFATVGVNTQPNQGSPIIDGAPVQGVHFYRSTDGDTGLDYRVYEARDGTDGLFLVSATGTPPDPRIVYTGQNADPGSIGLRWEAVEISQVGNTLTWTVDGVLRATFQNIDRPDTPDVNEMSATAGSITFGHWDGSGGSSANPNLQFTMYDNLVVSVPEPASLSLLGLVGLALLGRRRHV